MKNKANTESLERPPLPEDFGLSAERAEKLESLANNLETSKSILYGFVALIILAISYYYYFWDLPFYLFLLFTVLFGWVPVAICVYVIVGFPMQLFQRYWNKTPYGLFDQERHKYQAKRSQEEIKRKDLAFNILGKLGKVASQQNRMFTDINEVGFSVEEIQWAFNHSLFFKPHTTDKEEWKDPLNPTYDEITANFKNGKIDHIFFLPNETINPGSGWVQYLRNSYCLLFPFLASTEICKDSDKKRTLMIAAIDGDKPSLEALKAYMSHSDIKEIDLADKTAQCMKDFDSWISNSTHLSPPVK